MEYLEVRNPRCREPDNLEGVHYITVDGEDLTPLLCSLITERKLTLFSSMNTAVVK